MNKTTTDFLKPFCCYLLYALGFYFLQFYLSINDFIKIVPNQENLLGSDASFYYHIKTSGYDKDSHNTGFFVLFPLIWEISHLNVWGIIGFNILCFATGFALLMNLLQIEDKMRWLLYLTMPSVLFTLIPYTEALFFLLGTLLLFAIKKDRIWLIVFSVFAMSLVRATAMILLPALLAMELLSRAPKFWYKSVARFILLHALPGLAALAIFIYWQYYKTGIWFAYFKKQATEWGHVFSWPGLPFANIAEAHWRYHWLSALAMFLCTAALIILAVKCWHWISKRTIANDKFLVVSIGYLAVVLMSILFMNAKYDNVVTNVMGANRYTFITPFFFVFFHHLVSYTYTTKKALYLLLAATAFWGLFGINLRVFLLIFAVNTFLLGCFFIYYNQGKKREWAIMPLIAFNFMMQLLLFQQFIDGIYVD